MAAERRFRVVASFRDGVRTECTAGHCGTAALSVPQEATMAGCGLWLALWCVLCTLSPLQALDNGYGQRPGMGWEGDYGSRVAPGPGRGNATYITAIAKWFVTPNPLAGNKTPHELGYWYVNPSSSWNTAERDSSGNLVPDPAKYPGGIKPVADYIHSLGLAFGLYGDRGTLDCDKKPGQLGHELADAAYFASIGVDWFKSDSCYDSGSEAVAFAHYGAMRDALNKSGRPVWFALCGWKPWYAPPDPSLNYTGGTHLANSFRIGPDTGSGWAAVLTNVDNAAPLGPYVGPTAHGGAWNDGSLQLNPGMGCHAGGPCKTGKDCDTGQRCEAGVCQGDDESGATCMTHARHRSMFSMWCVLALNLVMTGNLPLITANDPFVMETWLHDEAIAVNQDPTWDPAKGLYALRLDNASARLGVAAPQFTDAHVAECGGEPDLQAWDINYLGRGYIRNNASASCVAIADCQKEVIYDGCETDPSTRTCAGLGNYSHFEWTLDGQGRLLSRLRASTCATVGAGGALQAVPCTSPTPASQKWTYNPDSSSRQLTNGRLCLTAGGGPAPAQDPHAVFGRPVQGTKWAVVLLNNSPVSGNVTCSLGCLSRMGFGPADHLDVRDVWARQDVTSGVPAATPFSWPVAANGSSAFLVLSRTQ